ncbi:unnamed protein product [Hermetia illucens]|uniref:SGTA homodimerisation domain-containing protein n=1 Tax=Hermetia illucens TaxID=343691 RepID=A0A7R8V8M4_HERIL|nr:small glutamine-rich tetratricopeptide repeat-containing protein beta [Hermetia illucens]CAD7094171.1 unnamed protein product [Hermetia illucens]
MSAEDCRHFVKCFLAWLKKQVNERDFGSDVVESIEVATQCLEAAYDITSDAEGTDESGQGATDGAGKIRKYPDVDLFDMFQSTCVDVLPDRKERAEEIKNEGNRLMKESKFNEALLAYNKAINLDATNATFYCNRAAAYIRLSEYEKAISDCKLALVYNPQYGKAYGRMGIAYSNLRKYEEACDAYRKAIELEPNNDDYKNNLHIIEGQVENLGQQLFNHIAGDNMNFRNLIMEILSDPQMSMASCEAASRVASQFPDVINEFQSQLSGFLNRTGVNVQQPTSGGSGGSGSTAATSSANNTSGNDEQQTPPPSDRNGGSANG